MRKRRKGKTRRKKSRPNKGSANITKAKGTSLPEKEEIPRRDGWLTRTILKYRKWIPVGIFGALVTLYARSWPESLELSNTPIRTDRPMGNPITVKNPNPYKVKDVKIVHTSKADFVAGNGLFVAKGSTVSKKIHFPEIAQNRSKHFISLHLTADKINSLTNASLFIVVSFKTPFIYPNVENDTTFYKIILDSDGYTRFFPE